MMLFYQKLYSQITDALVDDGYVVITNALETKLSPALLDEAKNEQDFKKAGISGSGDLHLDSDRRRDKISWLSKSADAQCDFLDFASGLQEYLNKELYLGLSYYESHFAIYDEGDFYE